MKENRIATKKVTEHGLFEDAGKIAPKPAVKTGYKPYKAPWSELRAKLRSTPPRAPTATEAVEHGSKVKSWLKGLKFGGIGAVDNPLLSKESMDKAQDAAGDAMEGDAIKKARVRPLRKGGMSA